MLNNPTPVPSPGSAALQEALNLIAGLGSGDKNLKKMLEDMKAVQLNNEKVAEEAVAAIGECNKKSISIKADAERLEHNRQAIEESNKRKSRELEEERLAFEKEKTDFSDRKRTLENSYNERHGLLVTNEVNHQRDVDSYKNEDSRLSSLKRSLDERETDISEREGRLYQMLESLKAYLK
jgi:hypothetical protein